MVLNLEINLEYSVDETNKIGEFFLRDNPIQFQILPNSCQIRQAPKIPKNGQFKIMMLHFVFFSDQKELESETS